MRKIFDAIDYMFDWICDFYHMRACDVLKLSALWGFIIILLGYFIRSSITQWIGLILCSGFAFVALITGVFMVVAIAIVIINELFAYTERVLFGKNRFFE